MDYIALETNLKKRVNNLPYTWGRKQNDLYDQRTKKIYKIRSYKELVQTFEKESNDIKHYAYNRWLNFWSAMAVESLFIKNKQGIEIKEANKYNKTIDIYIKNIPFDHKTTIIPKSFIKDISAIKTKENKIKLARWLYKNQSKEGRQHFENRIFVVLIDSKKPSESWKMKAEIQLIQHYIEKYLKNSKNKNIKPIVFNDNGHKFVTDIIYVIK